MPHARGKAPIEHDQPATRQSGVTIDEDGRAPRVAAVSLRRFLCGSERAADRDFSGLGEAPERDQQLARHRDDRDPARSTLQLTNALAKPGGEFALRLITQPEPCQLHKCFSRSCIASAADAPVSIHVATLMGHGCQADIARELFSIAEWTVKYFTGENRGKIVADAVDAPQCGDFGSYWIIWSGGKDFIPFRVQLTDQVEDKPKSPTQPVDLGGQAGRKLAAVAGFERREISLPVSQ